MTDKEIKQELTLLETYEYRMDRERVFEFLALFRKTNTIKWNSGEETKTIVKKHSQIFMYRTLVFSAEDEEIVKNFYYQYRKCKLLELLEQRKEEFDYLKGEQLSLF